MIGNPLPALDLDRCDGCGRCADVCPDGVLHLVAGWPRLIRESDCAYCGLCEEACPTGAIALVYEITMGGDP
jgi:NAD-dependent dihydropyrimidine dehydrogenase PreA subunit